MSSARHSLSGPRPLQLVDGNVPSAGSPSQSTSSCTSPTISGLSSAPATRRSFNKPRRQSSISYYSSDHTPQWDIRSPAASCSTLKRSNSLGPKVVSARMKGDRRSTGSIDSLSRAVDRGPLTLTEKHADLLHFIAQKESKCLELRSQLAVHEAELAQLKRKWERIISKGMDRAYIAPSASPPAANGAVLEGIKEGVQEVGRILLGDLSMPTAPPRTSRGHTTTRSTSSVSTAGTASTRLTNASSVRLSLSSTSSLAFDDPPRELDEAVESPDYVHSRYYDTFLERKAEIVTSPGSTATSLKATKIHRRKSREHPLSASSSPVSSPSTPSTPYSPIPPMSASRPASKRSSMNVSTGVPAASPVSSWMGTVGSSVGRKWEELQKGEAFTKSQKRASLLLSDVSSSLFAALAAPSPSSPSPLHSGIASSVSVSSNPFTATLSPLAPSPLSGSPISGPASGSVSLLDDDDHCLALGGVMVPDARPPVQSAPKTDDDEWNW